MEVGANTFIYVSYLLTGLLDHNIAALVLQEDQHCPTSFMEAGVNTFSNICCLLTTYRNTHNECVVQILTCNFTLPEYGDSPTGVRVDTFTLNSQPSEVL